MNLDTERKSPEELKARNSYKAAADVDSVAQISIRNWDGLLDMIRQTQAQQQTLLRKLDGLMTAQDAQQYLEQQAQEAAQQRAELEEVISDMSRQAGNISEDFSSQMESAVTSTEEQLLTMTENTQARMTAWTDRWASDMDKLMAKLRRAMRWMLGVCGALLFVAVLLYGLRMKWPV